MLAQILTQCQTILVDQWVIQLNFRADLKALTCLQVIFSNLEKKNTNLIQNLTIDQFILLYCILTESYIHADFN